MGLLNVTRIGRPAYLLAVAFALVAAGPAAAQVVAGYTGRVAVEALIDHPDVLAVGFDQLRQAHHDRVRHLFVFQHHSYFLQNPDEPDQYFNIPTAVRKRYLQWFHEYGVTHIFAGHYHRNAYGRDGNIEMITTGPVGKPLGRDQSGFRIVRLSDGAVQNRYYELGSIPNKVDPTRSLPEFPAPHRANQ